MSKIISFGICMVATLCLPAHAMTIGFADSNGRPIEKAEKTPRLLLSGVIEPGDDDRLQVFVYHNARNLRADPQPPIRVYLDSPGGDVEEASEIAATLREMMARVVVGGNMVCASSCFLLFINAPIHVAMGRIAVHRPYLSPAKEQSLGAADAARVHNSVYRSIRKWLQDRMVPQPIIERLLSAPSTEAYVLTAEDLAAIGDRAAWYEEWLVARCPDYLHAEKEANVAFDQGREPNEQYAAAVDCELDALGPEVAKGIMSISSSGLKKLPDVLLTFR